MGLYVSIQYGGDWSGEDGLTETVYSTPGDLFRGLSGQDRARPGEGLGRCTGKVYVDVPGSPCTLCHEAREDHEYRVGTNPITVECIAPGGTSADGRIWPNGMVGAAIDPKHPGGMALQHYYQAEAQHIGWVFVARDPVDMDTGRRGKGLREAWVTVHDAPDDVVRTPHYAAL